MWDSQKGISILIREKDYSFGFFFLSPPSENTVRRQPSASQKKGSLTREQTFGYLDLVLPSLQNCED